MQTSLFLRRCLKQPGQARSHWQNSRLSELLEFARMVERASTVAKLSFRPHPTLFLEGVDGAVGRVEKNEEREEIAVAVLDHCIHANKMTRENRVSELRAARADHAAPGRIISLSNDTRLFRKNVTLGKS